jgi:hypothetical protein
VAAIIKDATGIDPELVEGSRGEFTIWVGDEIVARKDARGFPSEDGALAAVRAALAAK